MQLGSAVCLLGRIRGVFTWLFHVSQIQHEKDGVFLILQCVWPDNFEIFHFSARYTFFVGHIPGFAVDKRGFGCRVRCYIDRDVSSLHAAVSLATVN